MNQLDFKAPTLETVIYDTLAIGHRPGSTGRVGRFEGKGFNGHDELRVGKHRLCSAPMMPQRIDFRWEEGSPLKRADKA